MSISLYAKVSSNQPVGPEIYLLTLEAPDIADAARPGQFVMLRVSPGPEPLLARPFSIHGVDGGKLLILYQVKGKGTKLLAQARPGQELMAWGPLGRGFDLSAKRPVLGGRRHGHRAPGLCGRSPGGTRCHLRGLLRPGLPRSFGCLGFGERRGCLLPGGLGLARGQRGRQHRPARSGHRALANAPGAGTASGPARCWPAAPCPC